LFGAFTQPPFLDKSAVYPWLSRLYS